jgi:hypothetical protein
MHPVEVRLEVPLAMWKGNNAFTDYSKAFTGLASVKALLPFHMASGTSRRTSTGCIDLRIH